MVTSSLRGHCIYFDGDNWRYIDNNLIAKDERPCARCGELPTIDGYDSCLGYIPSAVSACCGHGLTEPYIKFF